MASTFIRAFAVMLALTGFSATYSGGTSVSGSAGSHTVMSQGGGGLSGAPICTNNLPNCGLD